MEGSLQQSCSALLTPRLTPKSLATQSCTHWTLWGGTRFMSWTTRSVVTNQSLPNPGRCFLFEHHKLNSNPWPTTQCSP